LKATIDGSLPQGASVTAFAKAFAEEILAAHSGGPIHLMGYSAGGWYAFALAAALLQRQAPLGVVAILDTNPIGRVPRQLGLSLFSRMLGAELAPKLLRCLRRRQGKQTRRRYVLDVLQDLRLRTSLYLRVPLSPNHRAIRRWFHGTKPPAPEPFVQLVRESGHPRQGLPLSVDLFAIPDSVAVLSQLWRFYASKGVRTHPLFNDHHDFYQPENAQELAQALEQVLQEGERHLPDREMRLEP
jgi:thioesterase domain-containing protein